MTEDVEHDPRAPRVSGVRISSISPMEMERNTKTLRSTIWAVNDADSRADGEKAQTRNLFCFTTSVS